MTMDRIGRRTLLLRCVPGAVMLLLALGLHFGWTRPWQAQRVAAPVASDSSPGQRSPQSASERPAQDAATWRKQLPPGDVRQQRLADLLEIGIRLGLQTQRTEHRLVVDRDAGLERLRISMPVQGSYEQLRRFVSAALAHDPALSLDALRLRRVAPQSASVEAELQWSLHARSQEAKP